MKRFYTLLVVLVMATCLPAQIRAGETVVGFGYSARGPSVLAMQVYREFEYVDLLVGVSTPCDDPDGTRPVMSLEIPLRELFRWRLRDAPGGVGFLDLKFGVDLYEDLYDGGFNWIGVHVSLYSVEW